MTVSPTGGKLVRRLMRFERDFTQIPNTWLRDPKTGWRSKGVLVYLLSHQDGFEISLKGLANVGPDGYTAVVTAVRELEECGYLIRTQRRTKGGAPSHVTWEIADPFEPVDNSLIAPADLSTGNGSNRVEMAPDPHGYQDRENPRAENPRAENPRAENRRPIEEQLKNTLTQVPEVTTEGDSAPSQVDSASTYAVAIALRCKGSRRGIHDFDPLSGYCRNCALRSDDRVTDNTGAIA